MLNPEPYPLQTGIYSESNGRIEDSFSVGMGVSTHNAARVLTQDKDIPSPEKGSNFASLCCERFLRSITKTPSKKITVLETRCNRYDEGILAMKEDIRQKKGT
jgi:hypothetical protein